MENQGKIILATIKFLAVLLDSTVKWSIYEMGSAKYQIS